MRKKMLRSVLTAALTATVAFGGLTGVALASTSVAPKATQSDSGWGSTHAAVLLDSGWGVAPATTVSAEA